LDNYTYWKCRTTLEVDGNDTDYSESDYVGVFPLHNLTIYSPLNNSGNAVNNISVSFSVTDYRENIECIFNISNISILKSINSNEISYFNTTLYGSGTYVWNITCNSSYADNILYSGNYNYFVDVSPPQIYNLVNDQTLISPQIGENITLNFTVNDDNYVYFCFLEINDNGTTLNFI
jgi:hypothetical protein